MHRKFEKIRLLCYSKGTLQRLSSFTLYKTEFLLDLQIEMDLYSLMLNLWQMQIYYQKHVYNLIFWGEPTQGVFIAPAAGDQCFFTACLKRARLFITSMQIWKLQFTCIWLKYFLFLIKLFTDAGSFFFFLMKVNCGMALIANVDNVTNEMYV